MAGGTTGLAPVPHDGADPPSPEYDPSTVRAVGTGPLQVAVPFTMGALHMVFSPAENTTVPVGPADPVTDAA
jgi:hypothetical protein